MADPAHPANHYPYAGPSSYQEPVMSSLHAYPQVQIEAIPQPQPKVLYEPPVFRTFQERRRAKELSLRAAAGLPATPEPRQSYGAPVQTPSPATLAMMGQGGQTPPLPPPRSRSPSIPQPSSPHPLPPTRTQSTPRPLPSPRTTQGFPIPPIPSPYSPVQATVERSDTISSIRSLDRIGFSPSKRPLPNPPVGVNSSKSLDRGIPSSLGDSRRPTRKQPSIVDEEDELANGMARVLVTPTITADFGTNPKGGTGGMPNIPVPAVPIIQVKETINETQDSVSIPEIIAEPDPNAPAKFAPLPAINLPSDDDDDEPSPSGIAFSGLPVIAVTSENVPEIHLGDVIPMPTRVQSDSAILCAGCGQPIIGRIVNAMKKRFHPQCFRCDECGENLEHVSSYEWEGRAYCHLDYHDKFAHRCFHCKTPIVDARFVTLNDEVLGERYYHELHFFCSECGDPFLDPSKSSAPGTERTRGDDEETNAFVIHRGHPYCERCHLRLHKPKCKGCTKPIPDVAVNAMGAKWHRECFVCEQCNSEFANNLFFPKDGKAYCTECYEQMNR